MDMYGHLALLGIDHVDIRHANILYAPECPPGWPTLISPFSGNIYNWRLIDFEASRKTNWDLRGWSAYHESWVERLLEGLPQGYVLDAHHL